MFLASSPLLSLQIELKKINVVFVVHRLLNAISSEELNRRLHLLCLCNDTGDAYSDKGDHKLAAANAQRPRLTGTGGQLDPPVSDVTFLDQGGQLDSPVSDVTFFGPKEAGFHGF